MGTTWVPLLPNADPAACRDTRAASQWPETGRLALYLLGLRASCPPPDPGPQRFLVTWLKYYLEKDWAGGDGPTGWPRWSPSWVLASLALAGPPAGPGDSGAPSPGSRRHGHPLTSYYQYSLGVLALCVHGKRVREEVIQRLLVAEQHRRFRHAGSSAVGKGLWDPWGPTRTHWGGCVAPRVTRGIPADTEAVVALAFACLEREQLVRSRLAAELRVAVRGIRARFVEAQSENGLIGNIFSTPLAMQVGAGAGACASSGAWVPAGRCRVQVWVQVYGTTAAPCPRDRALTHSSPRFEPEPCPEPFLPLLPGLHRHRQVQDACGVRPGHGCAAAAPGRLHQRRGHGPGTACAARPQLPGHRLHAVQGGAW